MATGVIYVSLSYLKRETITKYTIAHNMIDKKFHINVSLIVLNNIATILIIDVAINGWTTFFNALIGDNPQRKNARRIFGIIKSN